MIKFGPARAFIGRGFLGKVLERSRRRAGRLLRGLFLEKFKEAQL